VSVKHPFKGTLVMNNHEILDPLFREVVFAMLRRHVASSFQSFMGAKTPCGDQRDQHH
jgi:hypothetical protein